MIKNQWYVLLDSREIKKNKVLGVIRLGEKLVFWRDPQGSAHCMVDLCPHLGARLSQGKVVDGTIQCPFHGFEYDNSGQCTYLPAYGRNGVIPKALRVKQYPVYEKHGFIWVYWGEPESQPEPPAFFDSFNTRLSYGSFKQHWNVHYSRMVENQLDVAHLPFVHYNTIGSGGRTVVDGPLVKIDGSLMNIWVFNRLDDGTPPQKADDLAEPAWHPSLQFRFPNLWQNWISDEVRILVAFVPVDEENAVMYGRFYQGFMKLPGLRELVNQIGVWSSIMIANQDRRIVNNQFQKRSDLKMGEKIMQSDRAILAYRRRRYELQQGDGMEN